MTITTDHPSSRFGRPVILDDAGSPLDPAPGLRAVRDRLGLTNAGIAAAVGKSKRTVEDWVQGRSAVPAEALYVLAEMLRAAGQDSPRIAPASRRRRTSP